MLRAEEQADSPPFCGMERASLLSRCSSGFSPGMSTPFRAGVGSSLDANDRRDQVHGLVCPSRRGTRLPALTLLPPVLTVPLPGQPPPGHRHPSSGRDAVRTPGSLPARSEASEWLSVPPQHLVSPYHGTSLCGTMAGGRPLSQQSAWGCWAQPLVATTGQPCSDSTDVCL